MSDPATIPANTEPIVGDNTPNFKDTIPEEYRDKPYLQDINDLPSLYKKLDGAESLIGKRPAGIPDDSTSPEDSASFYKAFGKPDNAEGYQFEIAEGAEVDEDFAKNVKDLFFKHNLSKKQGVGIQKGFDELVRSMTEKQDQDKTDSIKAFEESATELFGDSKDKILNNAKEVISKYVPETFKAKMEEASDEVLLTFAAAIDGFTKEYISEDKIGGKGTGPAAPVANINTLRAERVKLYGSEGFRNKFHAEHPRIMQRLNEINDTIVKINK